MRKKGAKVLKASDFKQAKQTARIIMTKLCQEVKQHNKKIEGIP